MHVYRVVLFFFGVRTMPLTFNCNSPICVSKHVVKIRSSATLGDEGGAHINSQENYTRFRSGSLGS